MRLHTLTARVAAIVAAVLALVATVAAVGSVPLASSDALVPELWRTVGLATWAAIFVLLAVRPRLLGIWVISLGSKIALVIVGLIVDFRLPGATDLVLWDGILSLVLAVGTWASARLRAIERTAPPS